MNKHIVWQNIAISKKERVAIKNQTPFVLWFTGLSGSGKSTIANALEQYLVKERLHTYLLDGDNIRHGLNKDLGFSDNDRIENIRRIGEVCKFFVDAGIIVIAAFISPFEEERVLVRDLLEPTEFMEVYVDTPLEICQQRDVKGLYKKAQQGTIKNFTGISSPYEKPVKPDIHIKTEIQDVNSSAMQIVQYLKKSGFIYD